MRAIRATMTESYVNAYVDGEFGERVVLLRRDDRGRLERRTIPAEYVSFHKVAQVPEQLLRQIEKSAFVRSCKVEGPWLRVGWRDAQVREDMCYGVGPERLSPLREKGVEHFEADVTPVRRFMIDSGAEVQKPRRCYLDFEGDSRVRFEHKEQARVLAWAVTDDAGNEYQGVLEEDTDAAELALLTGLVRILDDYDQVLAWNGDGYDFPVLKARTRARGVRWDSRRLLLLDHLEAFKRMNRAGAKSGEEKTSFALGAVAKSLLGRSKKDFDARYTWEAWTNRTPCEGALAGDDERRCWRCRKCMADYNLEDARLLPAIEKKNSFGDLFNAVAEVCHIFPSSRGLHSTAQMDGFMLRLGKERGLHFPSKRLRSEEIEDEDQFAGAYVMEPKPGILRDVHVFDFASLYPSIIQTWNMSPETKRPGIPRDAPLPPGVCRCPTTGLCFDTTVQGILPLAVGELKRLRKHYRDLRDKAEPNSEEWYDLNRKSDAFKTPANAFYGVVGSIYSRFHDRDIAESVTQNGAWLLKQTLARAEARGMPPQYGDTDSGYIGGGVDRTLFRQFVDDCNATFYPELLRALGCTSNHIEVENEKGFKLLVFALKDDGRPSAKRYFGYLSYYKGQPASRDAKPEVKGLEYKRGDTSLLARRLQADTIELFREVAWGNRSAHSGVFLDAARAACRHVLDDPLPVEEARVSKSLSKELGEYKEKVKDDGTKAAPLPHVLVGRILADRGHQVRRGTRIEYVTLDGFDPDGMRVVPAEDYDGSCDRHYLWEKLVYPPTARLLAAAFPESAQEWKALERTRPNRGRRRARPVPQGQLTFAAASHQSVGDAPIKPYRIGADEVYFSAAALERVKRLLADHPGHRPVFFDIRLTTGVVVCLETKVRVMPSDEMSQAIEAALWEEYASRHLLAS